MTLMSWRGRFSRILTTAPTRTRVNEDDYNVADFALKLTGNWCAQHNPMPNPFSSIYFHCIFFFSFFAILKFVLLFRVPVDVEDGRLAYFCSKWGWVFEIRWRKQCRHRTTQPPQPLNHPVPPYWGKPLEKTKTIPVYSIQNSLRGPTIITMMITTLLLLMLITDDYFT